jgi:hypothetical protein
MKASAVAVALVAGSATAFIGAPLRVSNVVARTNAG